MARVLIAEDEPHISESLTFLLTRAGFDVAVEQDGAAALDHLRRDAPQVMILDVMLPKMNGFDVLRAVRADAALAPLPVVMLTAKGQSQDKQTAEAIGVDAFITKPFANADVVDTVRRLANA